MLEKRGKFYYGSSQSDIREEIKRYSVKNAYVAQYFADASCNCGGAVFELSLDDDAGAAIRSCSNCRTKHAIGDSEEFLDEATLEECECPCGAGIFEITAGVSLYEGSEDVKWLYLGCRCAVCGLTAVYGDWKNEYSGYQEFLSRI